MKAPDLSIRLGNIKLRNPVMPASGTYGIETLELIDSNKLGAIIPKSITKEPRDGNRPPRVIEVTGGMLNSVGIQNKGLKHFIDEILPLYEKYDTPIIVSISAYSVDEFKEMVEILNKNDAVDAVELNISCPNLKEDGKAFGMSSKATHTIVKEIRKNTHKIIIPKLTPNVQDITEVAWAAEDAGADAVALTNTYIGMAIDIHKRIPRLGNIIGGLSGPAVKPMSLRMVWQTAQRISIPIIGIGGIATWEDAIEYILAGATAIQIGTANFKNPRTMIEIVKGIEEYMKKYSIGTMNELIGKLRI